MIISKKFMEENIFIVIACYNEGSAIIQLLKQVENVLKNINEIITVVVVDDGSSTETVELLSSFQFITLSLNFKLLALDYNSGHQAALEQGILFAASCNAKHVIIMDGDGEDDPAVIPQLLQLRAFDMVQVNRGKRGEGIVFRIGYVIYKLIFRLITKQKMNYGNFCMINAKVISIVQNRSFIHLAAFLSKLKLNAASIVCDRRKRFSGKSKMSLSGLVHHAFRSFVEYAEELVMTFLKLSIFLFILFSLTMTYILYLKIYTDKAILGWTSTLGIGLLTSALLCIGFFTIGVLLLNQSHHRSQIPPTKKFNIIK
jgi:glycosyltransferase involved in cell wall biosynthesis